MDLRLQLINKDDDVLQLIPPDQLSAEFKTFRWEKQYYSCPNADKEDEWPTYRMIRKPGNIHEFNWEKYPHTPGINIWRPENATLTCIYKSYSTSSMEYWDPSLHFKLGHVGKYDLDVTVHGKNDAAVVETAAFFWALQHSDEDAWLQICGHSKTQIDLSAIQPKQLVRMFQANPTRRVILSTGTFNAAQSVVLATRSHPYSLEIENTFSLDDGGTAFMDALEARTSSFGSLDLAYYNIDRFVNDDNLERLLKLELLEKLSLYILEEEYALLPFSTHLTALGYTINLMDMQEADLNSLNIIAKDLNLAINLDNVRDWDELLISFLNRVADLGHFERLCFRFYFREGGAYPVDVKVVARVAQALVRVLNANKNLQVLDLSRFFSALDWYPHMNYFLNAMKDNESLRRFKIKEYPLHKVWGEDAVDPDIPHDPDYSWLKQLLSRNRKIRVVDQFNNICSDGWNVDALYALNRFYCGSAALINESAWLRPLLVSTALTERASTNFQYSALLLADHADVLCDLIRGVLEDGSDFEAAATMEEMVLPSFASSREQCDSSKRTMENQLPRLAKRAARHDGEPTL